MLGVLFSFLTIAFLGLTYAAVVSGTTGGYVIAAAALALTFWFGSAAFRMLSRRR